MLPSHKRRSKSIWKICDLMPWLKRVVNSCVSTDNKGIKDCGQKIPVCLDPGTNGNCQVIGARGGERRCSRKAEVVILYQMVLHALFLLCCCFCSQDTHRFYGKHGSNCDTPACSGLCQGCALCLSQGLHPAPGARPHCRQLWPLPLRHSPGCSPRICSRPAQPGGFTAPAVSQLWLRPFLGSAAPSKTFVFLSVPSWVCQGSVLWCGSGRGPTLPLSTFSSIICFPDEHFCTFSHTVTKG